MEKSVQGDVNGASSPAFPLQADCVSRNALIHSQIAFKAFYESSSVGFLFLVPLWGAGVGEAEALTLDIKCLPE